MMIFPVIIITFAMPAYYQNLISDETEALTRGTLTSLTNHMLTYIEELERLTIAPYLNDEVLWALQLKAENRYLQADEYTRFKADQALHQSLPSFLATTRRDLIGTILLPMDGSVIVHSPVRSVTAGKDFPFREQPWYRKAVEADGNIAFINVHPQSYLKEPVAPTVFSVARLIKDPNTGRPLAVMMADADTVILENMFRDVRFNVGSIMAVFDSEHKLIYADRPLSATMIDQARHGEPTIQGPSGEYVAVSRKIPTADWTLTVFLSHDEIRSKLEWIYIAGILFALGGVLLAFLLFVFLSRSIIVPFKELIRHMKTVQSGNLDTRIAVKGRDEVAQLGLAFNKMTDRLSELINREYRAKLNEQHAKHRALIAQIRPHFLYNTLNGFIGLNRQGDRKQLEKAIFALSNLLRYSLDHNGTATLKKEFAFLEKYCDLQSLRFGERYEARLHCDKAVEDYRIPKLILQPLVENAILHGIEPADHYCTLSVTAIPSVSDNGEPGILIRIEDDGVGFPEGSDFENTEKHIGLNNVQERLAMAFKEAARFSIKPGIPSGTQVEIWIPGKDGMPDEDINRR